MASQMLYNSENRKKLKVGMDWLSKAVAVTPGPGGRNVVLQKSHGKHVITKDGGMVARENNLSGKFQNIGVGTLNKVAAKTGKEAGDGATTQVIIAPEIIPGGIKNLISETNPADLKKESFPSVVLPA